MGEPPTYEQLLLKLTELSEENKALRNDLHDRYVMAAMPIAFQQDSNGIPSDSEIIRWSRELADEAMRQRGGK